jgi:hypothetical protein
MVTARPPVDGAPGDDGSWRTAVGFARTARAKVAGFRSSVVPSVVGGAGGEVELVDYPDVEALAAVAVSAFAVPAAQGDLGSVPSGQIVDSSVVTSAGRRR